MSKISQRIIHSISTGPQPSEPLPKDVIIGPAASSSGSQYIQRSRYLYQWSNHQERNLDRIKLYQGTITPLPSQIRFYRNRARRVIAIFENGHDIEPPLLEDSQIPHATTITTREFLCDTSPQPPCPSALRQVSCFDFTGRSSCRGTSSNKNPPRRTVVPSYSHFAMNVTSRDRGFSTIGSKRQRETNDDERGESASKRSKSASFTSTVIAFVLGVAVGTFNSNIINRICEVYT